MTEALLPLPDRCAQALSALQADPVDPSAEAERHLRTCRACAEARVAFLAQEEAPEVLAPAGYHERLPDRILAKLPARAPLHRRLAPLTWAAAAAMRQPFRSLVKAPVDPGRIAALLPERWRPRGL